MHKSQGKLDLALTDYNKAIQINPSAAAAYNNRGIFYDEQGRPDLALANYDQAISLNPNYTEAYISSGYFLR
jgi:tetratricopeptide (TPR) repeat protein